MPRIRTIKPEFWTNGRVLECTRDARLFFIGLWNFADDAGRLPLRPRQLKAQIFPAEEDIDSTNIRRMIDELSSNGLVLVYESDEGDELMQIRGWDHQRIDRPQKPRYQGPSSDIRRTIDERSTSVRGGSRIKDQGKDHSPRAGARGSAKKKTKKKTVQKTVQRPQDIDPQIWEDWKRGRKAALTPTAWKPIENQLGEGVKKGYDRNDMLAMAARRSWRGFKLEWYENALRKEENSDTDVSQLWREVVAVASKGRGERLEWMDAHPELQEAVQAAGGLQQIGLMREWQQQQARDAFAEALQ